MGTGNLWNIKIFAILLGLIIFGGTLSLTYSLSTNFAIISCIGEVSTTKIIARSGSPADIQAAINAAATAGGGAVYIPAGTFHWNNQTVTIPGGVSVFGANFTGTSGHPYFYNYSAQTILHNDAIQYGGHHGVNDMFLIDGTNGQPTRVSGIRFEVAVNSSNDHTVYGFAIRVRNGAKDFRIDHNTFMNFTNAAIFVEYWNGFTERGVIDHNRIDAPYKDIFGTSGQPGSGGMFAYGIVVAGTYPPNVPWDNNITHFLGKYETAPSNYVVAYIEDNHFSRTRHAISSNQEAWYVARYNLIDNERPQNFGMLDVHGTGGSGHPGGRGLEAYNNVFIGTAGYGYAQGLWIRGGGGVIYDNTFSNVYTALTLYNESQYGSPSYAQVHDLYFWGNTGTVTNWIDPDGQGTGTGYLQNVNYFLYARPNYTPYPYPHPLTLSS